jgi:hypothetical protein
MVPESVPAAWLYEAGICGHWQFFDGRDWRRGLMLESVGLVLDNARTARNAVPQFLIRIMQ